LNRPTVAAAAPYAAPDPFGALNDLCPQRPVIAAPTANSQVQIFNPALQANHIRNNCAFAGLCPNAALLENQLLSIGVGVTDTIIDSSQSPAIGCVSTCGANPNGDASNSKGLKNDNQWPSNWTPAILDFFRVHPLSARPAPTPASGS
jgi:hypothetical protein